MGLCFMVYFIRWENKVVDYKDLFQLGYLPGG